MLKLDLMIKILERIEYNIEHIIPFVNEKSCDMIPFQIYDKVISGRGVEMAHDLCNTYTQSALDSIGELEDGDAKEILLKMVCYLKV